MRQVSIHELTEDVLRRSYDRGSLLRGRTYAAEDRVRVVSAAPGLLVGLATGHASQPYRVQVAWAARGASISVSDDCTCPVGLACKHAVALILTAQRSARATPAPGSPGQAGSTGQMGVTDPARLTGPERQFADWRRVFHDLRDEHAVDPDETPIAIEFAISTIKPSRYVPSPRPDVTLRPLRRGSKGAWIRTGVSWRDLESGYAYALRDIDPVHRNAARALLMSLTTNRYNTPATLPLGPAQPDVWQMLRRLVDAGVALVGERGGPTEVALAAVPARLAVDLVDAGDGAVRVSARLEHDDAALTADASAVGLLGDPPHGLFVVNGAQLTLVPFAQRLPRAAGRLLATPLVVPPADVDELLDAYVPLMAQHGRVGSSDGSIEVVLSEFVGVVAQVRRVVPDVAELTWGLRYRRGQRITTHPLAPTSAVGRDRDAEVAAIDALELPVHLLASIVWPDGRPRATVASGRDTVTLMAEVVPWLLERGQVLVEVDSELPALREALGDPLIELSVSDGAADTDGADGQRTDWFDLSVQVSVDGEDVEFASLFAALSRDDEVLFLSSGSWLRLDRPEFARLRELIGEASGLADGAVGDGVRINRFQTSWWDELAGLGVIQHQSERWQRSVAQLGSLTAPARIEPPEGLQAELRDYQREGFDWLVFLAEHGLGGVLADDMGLGKTVQTLALMLHSLDRKPSARFLVVAPTSVVENWHREASQFAPSIEVATIAETARRRGRSLAEAVGSAALVVTSYALFRIEFDEYQALGWDLLVLDEAQFVKNHQGKTYQCARRLNAASKLAITGTPLENSLMDLWSLLSITAPGLYPDPKRFSEVYRVPIESGRAPELLTTLRRRIAPLMRRRTKDEVLSELPPKTELTVEVPMNAKHARIYQTQLQRQRQKVLGLVGDMRRNRFEILKSLTLLRQLSLDPGLVDEEHAAVGSAKLDRLVDDLAQVVAEGHRALVFSQFTRYLAKLKVRLDEEGIGYSYLDGRTRHRDQAISRFKDGGAPVFVISLKAGGFGLNLTEADYCFVLDPWWNPAVEMQAVDRAHRIGQVNPVIVYRYVSTGTIEEKVMDLKARKAALFSDVMDADGALSGALSADDIRGMFDL